MTERTRYQGIYPIMWAFFDDAGRLDEKAMRHQVSTCIETGAHGIVVLGLVTEMNKLSREERQLIVEWTGDEIGGRVPYAVTVPEPSIPGQIEFCHMAKDNGADWVILQPPPVKGVGEAAYVDFFGQVAESCPLPLAIQNNPFNMEVSVSNAALAQLGAEHDNIQILKAEGAAEGVARLIEQVGMERFDLFSGRGGLELITTFTSGCKGCIPAPDMFDVQLKIYDLFFNGGEEGKARADALYKEILPMIVFFSQTLNHTLTYGKYLTARRLGLDNCRLRHPFMKPTEFGLKSVDRMTKHLGKFGQMYGPFAD